MTWYICYVAFQLKPFLRISKHCVRVKESERAGTINFLSTSIRGVTFQAIDAFYK